jgi:cyclopropane fatty-acyl-phospholipid synthase-like methyltransferase
MVSPAKPHAPSCERNRDPILAVLQPALADCRAVLEVGSGTGQHAIYFAARLPHLLWQTSDQAPRLAGIRAWLEEAGLPNTPPPLALDVSGRWPARRFDAVFSANTLHIMAWLQVTTFFAALPGVLRPGGQLLIYGPFNYGGRYTSPGNARFDASLRAEAAYQGIRDFEAVDELARNSGFVLVDDHSMPANNRCLVWRLDGSSAQGLP